MTAITPKQASPPRIGLVVPIVLLAVFVVPLSVSGTAVALNGIAADLGSSPIGQQCALNGFNLTFACSTLVWGSAADIIGRWRAFLTGSILFATGSAVSIAAHSYALLDTGRIVAGAGAGAVFAVGSALISTVFTGEQRTRIFSLLGAVAGLSLAFGPSLCGLVTDVAGWRWIYGFQGIFLIAVIISMPLIRDTVRHERKRVERFDALGAGLFCAATALVLGGMVLGSVTGWLSAPAIVNIQPVG